MESITLVQQYCPTGFRICIDSQRLIKYQLSVLIIAMKLEKLLVNDKITVFVKGIYLPSIISNITNNKNELWKSVGLTGKFSKTSTCNPLQPSSNLSIRVSFCTYLLCYLNFLLTFWGVIFKVHSILWQFPLFEVWQISRQGSFNVCWFYVQIVFS